MIEQRGQRASSDNPIRDSALLFDLMPDAIIAVDRSGVIRHANRQCVGMFGYAIGELLGQQVEMLMPASIRAIHVRHRLAYQEHPVPRHMGGGLDLKGRRKDGREFPVDIMISPLPNPSGLILAVVRDTTTNAKMNDELRRLAYTDVLTGLPNRSALYRDLNVSLARGDKADPMAIVLFDLDGFKEVNDTLGHLAGDQLLRICAQRCIEAVGDEARVYRLGGDEFVATMKGCGDPRLAAATVKKLMAAIDRPFQIDGQKAYVSTCVGIALAPANGASGEELLANVDLALYRAKESGRNQYNFFQHSFRAEAHARREMDLKLRQAHSEREFEVYFQPTIRLSDRGIVGAEALLRWRENGRIIAPEAFIEMLSGSPIVGEVGDWILAEACRQAASWPQMGHPLRVGVNLFPNQFHNPDFTGKVRKIITDSGLSPSALQLEITETIALSCSASVLASLQCLRDMGIGLAFDDFGTGYASLSFLTRMPLTHIKIDKTFVAGIPDDKSLCAIVHSLVAMAHNIGLRVIAEGVETQVQAEFLEASGCDEAQGYLFSRALPAEAFKTFLRNQPSALGRRSTGTES